MRKRAIIFDLDNTIYSVRSIGVKLFASLFELISQDPRHTNDFEKIRNDIMRKPFQLVAGENHFSKELTEKGISLLKDLTYEGEIKPFDDFAFVRSLRHDKFLVTTGFLKLQQSKIVGMKLENEFNEIHIVDPATSNRTKKDVFADIIQRHHYGQHDVLVVGDDLNSEIRAARQLGLDAILYDKLNHYRDVTDVVKISDFTQLSDKL